MRHSWHIAWSDESFPDLVSNGNMEEGEKEKNLFETEHPRNELVTVKKYLTFRARLRQGR